MKLKMIIEQSIVLGFLLVALVGCGGIAKSIWEGMWVGNCEQKTNIHAAMKRERKPQATIDYAYDLMVKACSKK